MPIIPFGMECFRLPAGTLRTKPYTLYIKERCFMEQTIDILSIKLERIHVLADALFYFVDDNPKAQALAAIIMETAAM